MHFFIQQKKIVIKNRSYMQWLSSCTLHLIAVKRPIRVKYSTQKTGTAQAHTLRTTATHVDVYIDRNNRYIHRSQ